MELDIEAIRKTPRQFVDLETVIALSDRCMVLALQADEVNAARIYLREKGRLLTELAEKNAEIERLERLADAIDKRAGERIAASQAREQQLLDVLGELHDIVQGVIDDGVAPKGLIDGFTLQPSREVLALPQDTTALEDMITKAGEVMRERCRIAAWPSNESVRQEAIRSLPGVTLEDLK